MEGQLDGSFIYLTVKHVEDIFAAVTDLDAAAFAAAETHRGQRWRHPPTRLPTISRSAGQRPSRGSAMGTVSLLFSTSGHPMSAAIRLSTWSDWSHVAIDGDEVIEATALAGVRHFPVVQAINHAKHGAIVELPCDPRPEEVHAEMPICPRAALSRSVMMSRAVLLAERSRRKA